MTPELRAAIRAAVLANEAPAIVREIIATCEEEAERLRKIDLERFMRDGPEKEPRSPAAWAKRDAERKTDPWLWWTMFAGRNLSYVADHMDQALEERDWTNAQKDERRKKEEVEKKREELRRLETGIY